MSAERGDPGFVRYSNNPTDTCCCGDYRRDHAGPENRGSCRVCRNGTPPPEGADGCQRFRLPMLGSSDLDPGVGAPVATPTETEAVLLPADHSTTGVCTEGGPASGEHGAATSASGDWDVTP